VRRAVPGSAGRACPGRPAMWAIWHGSGAAEEPARSWKPGRGGDAWGRGSFAEAGSAWERWRLERRHGETGLGGEGDAGKAGQKKRAGRGAGQRRRGAGTRWLGSRRGRDDGRPAGPRLAGRLPGRGKKKARGEAVRGPPARGRSRAQPLGA
jgi:hypothetical protein